MLQNGHRLIEYFLTIRIHFALSHLSVSSFGPHAPRQSCLRLMCYQLHVVIYIVFAKTIMKT